MAKNKRIFGIQSLLSKIIIADNILPALIDSGASISVIRADVFGKFSNFSPSLTLEASDIQASAINGSMLQFKGMCLLPCRWFKNGPMFSFKFYICAHLSVPCVVGFDLLHKQKCAVDFSRGLLDVGDAVLECISPLSQWFEDNSPTTETSLCSVTSRFLIPPRSEALVKCNLKSHHAHKFSSSSSRTSSDATVGLVEPHVGFTSLNSLLVASSLVTVSQNEFWLRVLNPTCNSVTLYPSQTIAQILPYNETVLQTVGFNAVDINSAETLMQLFKSKFSTLTKKQQKDAFSLLKQFADVFATDKWDLGSCNLHKLRIQLKDDAQPSRVPYRSMNPSKRKDLKDKITKLQEKDLISPTHSEWAAPTVLVPKRDGSYRLVIDYRKLNAQTVKTSWPLPRISDILNNLEGSIFFSSLDLCSGFHQMEIDEEDRHLTSFITPFGLYQWKRMPMGLCNAPGAFQRLMEIVLSGLTYEIVLVYLDDIIVFGRSFEEHIHRLQLVFQRIREANLKISPAKCSLFQTKLVFLGHVVSADGIHTDPAKIAAVEKYPVPQTIRQLRSFMGLVGFYRKFVLNFGLIANPLYQLMNKTTTFHWTADCQKASIFEFSPEHPGVQISSADSMYLSGKTASRDDSRVFYIELLNTTVSVCSYKVRPTTYSGVYFVIEPITEQLPEIDYNTDAIPNLVYGTKIEFVHVNAHLSRQRIVNFIKNEICNTRQMILNGLISLASNLDNPNLFLGSGSMLGIHAEKAGAVLYVHKCVKVEARIADFPYCTEEVPVLLGNDTQIRFMNPITQVVYPNYTLTACDPIAPYMYRTSEGIWMHYGDDYSVARTPESLSVFSHLDFSDNLPSLHTAGLFSYQNLRQSAKARVLKYSRRTISGREVYLGPRSQYSHPGLMHFNPSVSEELENLAAWKYLIDLQSVASGGWYYAERCTVITLTTLALLGLFIYILKLVFALRLLSHGVPFWTIFRLLNPLAPFTQMLQNHINNIHASAPVNHDQLVNETDGNPDNRTVIVDSIYPSAQLNSARYTTKI